MHACDSGSGTWNLRCWWRCVEHCTNEWIWDISIHWCVPGTAEYLYFPLVWVVAYTTSLNFEMTVALGLFLHKPISLRANIFAVSRRKVNAAPGISLPSVLGSSLATTSVYPSGLMMRLSCRCWLPLSLCRVSCAASQSMIITAQLNGSSGVANWTIEQNSLVRVYLLLTAWSVSPPWRDTTSENTLACFLGKQQAGRGLQPGSLQLLDVATNVQRSVDRP